MHCPPLSMARTIKWYYVLVKRFYVLRFYSRLVIELDVAEEALFFSLSDLHSLLEAFSDVLRTTNILGAVRD